MILGFTGSRYELPQAQEEAISWALIYLKNAFGPILEAHHGACVGADEAFHAACSFWRIPIIVHPASGVAEKWLSKCYLEEGNVIYVHDPLPPLTRNTAIAGVSTVALAAPDGPRRVRSGTWSAIRRFEAKKIPVYTINPRGEVKRES